MFDARSIDRKLTFPTESVLDIADVEMRELLDTLDSEKRSAFVLTKVMGLSYEEAAAVRECPIGTIRSRVARARAHLASTVRRADAS